jgi:hypothetical protein
VAKLAHGGSPRSGRSLASDRRIRLYGSSSSPFAGAGRLPTGRFGAAMPSLPSLASGTDAAAPPPKRQRRREAQRRYRDHDWTTAALSREKPSTSPANRFATFP